MPFIIRIFALVMIFSLCGLEAWAADDDKRSFLEAIEKKCTTTYFPTPEWDQSRAQASFQISCDRKISNIKIIQHHVGQKTHRSSLAGDACLIDAVRKLEPLPKLPNSISCPVGLMLVFDAKANKMISAQFIDKRVSNDKLQKEM